MDCAIAFEALFCCSLYLSIIILYPILLSYSMNVYIIRDAVFVS